MKRCLILILCLFIANSVSADSVSSIDKNFFSEANFDRIGIIEIDGLYLKLNLTSQQKNAAIRINEESDTIMLPLSQKIDSFNDNTENSKVTKEQILLVKNFTSIQLETVKKFEQVLNSKQKDEFRRIIKKNKQYNTLLIINKMLFFL